MFGALSRVWLILVGLFLTPLILSHLGDERFALWAIFWSITAYVMLMDMGMGVSIVRQTAQAWEKHDTHTIYRVVVSVVVMMLGTSLLIWLLIAVASVWLLPMLSIKQELGSDIEHLVHWAPLVFLLIAVLRVFDATLRGLQRFDLILGVTLTTSVVNVLGIYLALTWG